MSDADALLAAVIAHPDEDTPRLMYADWLDEHAGRVPCPQPDYLAGAMHVFCGVCGGTGVVSDGRAERAEFIRVQVSLAGMAGVDPGCPRGWHQTARPKYAGGNRWETVADPRPCGRCWVAKRAAAQGRERELWAAGTRDFDAAFPGGLAGVLREFRRGFVEAVTCPADWWLAHGDAVRRAHPVTRVTWEDWPLWHVCWGGDGFRWFFRDRPGEVYALRHDSPPEEDAEGLADICGELLAAYWPGVQFGLPLPVPVPDWMWQLPGVTPGVAPPA